ncbi:MAG: GTP cyclohydrolase I FolE2 [Verrucomicrobia bacterium]|nr:GTP cyclohydrolase I FolE2 [Verrucomicrobiota bacterium]
MAIQDTTSLLQVAGSDSTLRPERTFETGFAVTPEYKNSLPDMQNTDSSEILGANVPILQVGISNFRLPLRYMTADGEPVTLETSVTGTVSLGADKKGINMSRIMRVFYEFKDRVFTPELLEEILQAYAERIDSRRARLKLSFSYPMMKQSLRSDMEGYQYYECAYEGELDDLGRFRKIIHFDFVYSSACPCSSELSEHAREFRNIYAVPHSQRSKARVSVDVRKGQTLTIEDLQAACEKGLRTETQVMVKREDEQAFAELNGSQTKFVEDAARLLYEQIEGDSRIFDFQIACAHLESLHSHDAVAVINKGVDRGFSGNIDDFRSLIC